MVKKNRFIYVLLIVSIFLIWGSTAAPAQTQDNDTISLTWQDLQKLLNLDRNEIKMSWDELKKILAQTGSRVDTDFDIKDGIITINRERFSRILERMKPALKRFPLPPQDFIISEAAYTGTAGEHNSSFTAVFKIYVFKQDKPHYINIPVIHTGLAVKDIRVNNEPAVILTQGSWHHISVAKSGFFEVKTAFSAAQGNQSLYLPVARSVGTRIDYTILKRDLAITVSPAINTKTENLADRTRGTANTVCSNWIRIDWTRQVKPGEKQAPLFYAETRSLISVDADILRLTTRVNLEIIQGNLNTISLTVPPNYQVVRVDGAPVSEWRVRDTNIGRVLEIPFRYDIDGLTGFTIQAEHILAEDTLAADFSGFKVPDARRETGDIGIAAESSVQVEVEQPEGGKLLEKLPFHNLPPGMLSMTAKPILSAFKYAGHPYRLIFRITKHHRLQGITTVIESADINALFLEEGKTIVQAVYTVKNTFKQFMEIDLPEEAGIWTVYVDNKRGKASKNEQGKLLIPLLRSAGNGELLKPFTIEFIYTLPAKGFGVAGKGECLIPACDIFINKMRMILHLPPGYGYDFDRGEWAEEVDITRRAVKPAAPGVAPQEIEAGADMAGRKDLPAPPGKKKTEDDLREGYVTGESEGVAGGVIGGDLIPGKTPLVDGDDKPILVDGANLQALPRGRSFSQIQTLTPGLVTGPVGISSIRVFLPLSGKRYVFSKKIIDKNEFFPLHFSYFNRSVLRILLIAGILFLLLVFFAIIRRKIKKRLTAQSSHQ